MKTKILIIPAVIILILTGCTTSTYITGTWKNSRTTNSYHNIMVAALTSNVIAKSTLENSIAKELEKEKNLVITKSIDEFPPTINSKDSSKASLMRKIKNKDVDAILTVSILKTETESRYIRGSGPYYPAGYVYYNSLWGYYDYWYPYVYDNGYYVQDKVYYIEANLYDARTQNLVWSAQSKTYSPDALDSFVKEYASVIVSRMKKEELLDTTRAISKSM
jgi:hypothetical protein